MGKKYRSKKRNDKLIERIFIALIALAAVLVVVLIIAANQPVDTGYVVTEDGHVHDAAGNHIGDYDELLANGGLVMTEDGHLHDAAGNHVDVADSLLVEDAAEVEEATEPAEDAAE